jgi:hypothetical protein
MASVEKTGRDNRVSKESKIQPCCFTRVVGLVALDDAG